MSKAIEQQEPMPIPACTSCGDSGDGVELEEFIDEGDPSVGYGPITEVLCNDCATAMGLTRER